MALTPKQEKFAQGVASGMTQADAYRAAYPASEKWADATVHKRASELARNGAVLGRVEELQKPVIEKVQLTLEEHLEELRTLRELAKGKEDYGAAIKAETKRGEAVGFYKQRTENKHEHSGPNGGDIPVGMSINVRFVRPE